MLKRGLQQLVHQVSGPRQQGCRLCREARVVDQANDVASLLAADLEVLIVLGTDEMTAEDAVDSLAPIAVTAITTDATITALGVGNISLEPQVVVIDSPDPAQLFALVLAVTITELEN